MEIIEEKEKIARITKCEDCGYRSMSWGLEKCSKCGGKLEIIASEVKQEVRSMGILAMII